MNVNDLYNKLPLDLLHIMNTTENVRVAGGSVMRAMVGKFDPAVHDIDLFVHQDYKDQVMACFDERDCEEVESSGGARRRTQLYYLDLCFDVVVYHEDTFLEKIKKFDLNMSQIAMNGAGQVQVTEAWVEGNKSKQLKVVHTHDCYKTEARYKKYLEFLGQEWECDDFHLVQGNGMYHVFQAHRMVGSVVSQFNEKFSWMLTDHALGVLTDDMDRECDTVEQAGRCLIKAYKEAVNTLARNRAQDDWF